MNIALRQRRLPLRRDTEGVIRLKGTRVTLDTLIAAYLAGCTADEIAERYPTADLAAIYATIAWYLDNRTTVDTYLRQRAERAAEIRRENEARWSPVGLRARLLRRRRRRSA